MIKWPDAPPAWAGLASLSTSSIIISSEQCRIPFVQSKHHEQLLQGSSLKKLDSKIKLFTLHCLSTACLSFQKANSEWHRPRAKTPTENCLAQAQSSWLNEDVIIFTGECSVIKILLLSRWQPENAQQQRLSNRDQLPGRGWSPARSTKQQARGNQTQLAWACSG